MPTDIMYCVGDRVYTASNVDVSVIELSDIY